MSGAAAATAAGMQPLALSLRGRGAEFPHPENVHLGVVCVVSGRGETLLELGDPARGFPLRSVAKPFQLLPYLLEGLHRAGRGRPATAPAELALMMASHAGEPMHTERVARLLARAGLGPETLLCGVHPPLHWPTRAALAAAGAEPSALHCNCSGKHAAMLTVCRHRDWPLASYLEAAHPLQRWIAALLRALAALPEQELPWVVDGCSLPTFVMPVAATARLYACLACPAQAPPVESGSVESELGLLFDAAVRHPEMIAGSGCLDTLLMDALGGSVLAKSGAAGYYALAVRPGRACPEGLGIAIKLAEPDPDGRVRGVIATTLLRELGVVPETDTALAAGLERIAPRRIHNLRGLTVGEIRPAFGTRT